MTTKISQVQSSSENGRYSNLYGGDLFSCAPGALMAGHILDGKTHCYYGSGLRFPTPWAQGTRKIKLFDIALQLYVFNIYGDPQNYSAGLKFTLISTADLCTITTKSAYEALLSGNPTQAFNSTPSLLFQGYGWNTYMLTAAQKQTLEDFINANTITDCILVTWYQTIVTTAYYASAHAYNYPSDPQPGKLTMVWQYRPPNPIV